MSYDVLGTREHPSLGLDTFGDAPLGGAPGNHAETLREVVAEAVLADRVGVDYIGLGEHHRADYAVSDGRAEVQLGRGSFIESFSLFGLDLGDYDRLFAEKLDLFAALQSEQPVSWEGTIRPPVEAKQVYPTTAAGKLPAWIAVGGTPESVVRAARYGMPLVLAVIGGSPAAFVQFADLYRRALGQYGHDELPIGMHSPGHIAATDAEAREQLYPHQADLYTRLGRERGWGPYSQIAFQQAAGPQGAMFVGSPDTVATKVAWAVQTLGLSRFQLKYSVGALPHDQRMESIRLYGEEVIPRVRRLLAED